MPQILRQGARAVTAATVALLMVAQPLLYAAPAPSAAPASAAGTLQGNDRILHALNRFTYGPRPGDVEAVQKMGLDKWFAQQLNPAGIDNSDLQARLEQYPAMQMNEQELMMRFPTNQMIRAISNGLQPMPSDPTEHAIYADQIYFYNTFRAKQAQAGKANAADGAPPMMADADMQKDGANSMAGNDTAGQAMTPAVAAKKGKGKKTATEAAIERNGDAMSREDMEALIALPAQQRYDRILAMTPQQLLAFRAVANRLRGQIAEGMTPSQREVLGALGNSRQVVGGELLASTLTREIYSTHQLQEVMTDFWLNHFNVYVKKNEITPYQLVGYERDTIAPHALGRFEDLLIATAKSPAMIDYLDNQQSTGPDSVAAKHPDNNKYAAARLAQAGTTPDAKIQIAQAQQQRKSSGLNENYARELMELHTLGVNGGYTQKDVTEVAKVFTGWTIDRPYRGGQVVFDERRHEPGAKTVLGTVIPEGGVNEGMTVLHMLATSPQTAHFISRELAVRFVADEPPQSLVDRMADTFLASKGDIKAVLTTMYKSPEFWSKDAYRAKVKTPLEYVLSAVRASDAQIKSPIALGLALDRLGMPIYGCQPPTGYYWRASDWVSTSALVSRMNFALALSVNALPGISADWSSALNEDGIASAVPTTAGVLSAPEKEQRLESLLLNRPVSEKTRQTVLTEAESISVEDAASKFPIDLGDIANLSGGQPGGGAGGRTAEGRDRRYLDRMGENAGPNDRQASIMAGLLLGSPEFQRR